MAKDSEPKPPKKRKKIVAKLERRIKRDTKVKDDFNAAIEAAQKVDLYNFKKLKGWRSYKDYLDWLDELLEWTPHQKGDSRNVYNHIVRFYYILDQKPLKKYQSSIHPEIQEEGAALRQVEEDPKLKWLSQWMVAFAKEWGKFMDTPESAERIKSFKNDKFFTWDTYMPPPSNYPEKEDWKAYRTFNQFFARHTKPGMRPIAGLCDNSVIVSPADCSFVGWWQIDEQSDIYVEEMKDNVLEIKGLWYSIHDLLRDSAYKDRFRGGIFTHSFLNSIDYHRWHTPVQGKVVEAKVIQGQVYLDVHVEQRKLRDGTTVNVLSALDGTGYQFVQTRGLIVIDSPIGLVACLPMGMAQVSSVVITADVGVTLHKGEELGYFQFGGSDWVMVFERDSNVELICRPNVHYNQGSCIGRAHPYAMK